MAAKRGSLNGMKWRYIVRRLCIAVPTFFGITLIVYIIASFAPGSPLDAFLADPRITAAELARKKTAMGLDRPVAVQYLMWLKAFLGGDFGFSFSTKKPVLDVIIQRMGPTLLLAFSSVVLSVAAAVFLGISAASRINTVRDYAASGLSLFMLSSPNFFVGLVLIYIFSVKLKLLPSNGLYDSAGEKSFGMLLRHMILPVLVLSFQHIGNWTRHMRSSVISTLTEDYIRTARAKGLGRTQTILRHALRNSLTPLLTVIGMSIPEFVGGAVITEQIFSWPGVGSLMVQAISSRDYPVIMGITVFVALLALLSNLVTDILYGQLDPRVRYE
ncbi:MAG: ABC transporter permease [Synergistaceae bacterium]|jgi:peptide/nickel transport system permease protein|nr:ABC transporter permease [Synergistaceae bacterium]